MDQNLLESESVFAGTKPVEMGETPAPTQDFIRSRGLRFPKDRNVITQRIRASLRSGDYEKREADAVLKLVKRDDTVIELGGGIGYISSLLAKRSKVKAVHSFEANPTLVPYIQRVYAANGITNAHVRNAILGPEPGTATFYVRNNFLASSMYPVEGTTVVAQEQVEVLDARAVMAELKPTALICDIEGAEADVIPLLDLSGVRVAVVELHPQWIGPQGVNAVFQSMMQAGLSYFPRGSNAKVVCFLRDW